MAILVAVIVITTVLWAPVDVDDLCSLTRIDALQLGWPEAQRRIQAALSDVAEPFIIVGLHRAVEAPTSVPWLVAWREALSWSFESLASGAHANISVHVGSVESAVGAQFGYNALQSGEDFLLGRVRPQHKSKKKFGTFLRSITAQQNPSGHQLFSIGTSLHEPTISPLPQLAPSFPLPDFLSEYDVNGAANWRPIISVGGANRTVAHHTHGRAWLASVQGTKRWFLHPPDAAPSHANRVYAGTPAAWADEAVAHASRCARWRRLLLGARFASLGWLAELLRCGPPPPLICDVARGEALLLPPLWFHATTNPLGPSIAVGHQQSMRMASSSEKMKADLAKVSVIYPHSPHLLRLQSRMTTNGTHGVELLADAVRRNPVDFQARALHLFALVQQYGESGVTTHYDAVLAALRETRMVLRELYVDGIFSKEEVTFVLRSLAAAIEAANDPRAMQAEDASRRIRPFLVVDRERLLRSALEVEAGRALD